MRNTFLCLREKCLPLYEMMYNDNKYFNYTSSCIMRNTLHVSRNICCYYILPHIMTTNILIIHRLI